MQDWTLAMDKLGGWREVVSVFVKPGYIHWAPFQSMLNRIGDILYRKEPNIELIGESSFFENYYLRKKLSWKSSVKSY